MDRARVPHEVDAGPGVGSEEIRRQSVALQAVTTIAREDDVAGTVRTAVREGINVVEGR